MEDFRYIPKPGMTTCLRCNNSFESVDRKRIRICPKCHQQGPLYGLRDVNSKQIQVALRDRE